MPRENVSIRTLDHGSSVGAAQNDKLVRKENTDSETKIIQVFKRRIINELF
jgi:hypothetical protein